MITEFTFGLCPLAFLLLIVLNKQRLNDRPKSLAALINIRRRICHRTQHFVVSISLLNETEAGKKFDSFAHGLRSIWIETLCE